MTTKGLDFLEMKCCAVCGNRFSVLYPHLWSYKTKINYKNFRYYCSWRCLRADEQRRSNEKMARMKKDGTPAKKPGRKPQTVIEKDIDKVYEAEQKELATVKLTGPIKILTDEPEKVEIEEPKTAGEAMAACMDTAQKFFDLCDETTGRKNESKPEEHGKALYIPFESMMKFPKMPNLSGFTVTAIKGDYGRYARDTFNGTEYLDYETCDGEEISMPVEAWNAFLKELKEAAGVLGVPLNDTYETDPS